MCFWSSKNHDTSVEIQCGESKVNTICEHSKTNVYSPFFDENYISDMVCIDMLEQWQWPQ